MNIFPACRWIFHVGLCTSIFTLGFVCIDRTHLPLAVIVIGCGVFCWIMCWHFGRFSLTSVIVYAVLFRLMLAGVPPSLSDDAYRYVWDGLIQKRGGNPYEFAPQDVPWTDHHQDIIYERLNSKSFISVYPPVSQLIFRFGAFWHRSDTFWSYYVVKAIFILAELMAIFILSRIVSSGFVLFYAWNPIVILETAGQAHTESAVLLALVLVLYLAQKNRVEWASVFLAMAGWIKLFPFIFFPFLWTRYGWRAVWPGILAGVLLALPFSAPYVPFHVAGSLNLYARFFEFNAGIYSGIKSILEWFTGDDWSKQLGPFMRLIFLCGLPVLYTVDYRQHWPLARAMLITTGAYLALTTTVHPWYLLVPLFLCASLQVRGFHWVWLSACSIGTYLLYVGGPYWTFVILGWAGWGAAGMIRYVPEWMHGLMRFRARKKVSWIRPFLPRDCFGMTLLDLGCAEGYVGEHIQHEFGAGVQLADVVSMNQTQLPHVLLKPGPLPWPSGRFDVVLLCFVLHHARNPEHVLREAIRVSSDWVIVVESVYTTRWQHRLLSIFDCFVNRFRSWGRMKDQEKYVHFRTSSEWRKLFVDHGGEVVGEFQVGFGPFTTAGFVLRPRA